MRAAETPRSDNVLEVRDLHVQIASRRGTVRAVDGVSLEVPRGEAVGLVGESGSGKSMTLRAMLGVLPPEARVTSGEILVAKRQDYVVAARSGGLSAIRIMAKHLLPNVITQAIIYAMSDIVQDILAIVTLGYFGLGIPPPTPDLGSMINDGQNFMTTHWQLTTIPGLAVVVVGLGLSLIGDGLADLIRPGQS